jgi:type I restriction enzyme M protein
MYEQSFKNIDAILRQDSGSATELDYIEQTSWILFLKYLDDLEVEKNKSAQLAGKKRDFILDKKHRWETWAAPKTPDGKIDHNIALTGDDLTEFVNNDLFQYLKKFRVSAESADTIEYKIGEIFHELTNKIHSGYALREILEIVDALHFQSDEQKHELSHLYESKIKNMGNAGRNGGEYYTPRPLIRTIVQVVDPKIGEKVYDGAVGSAGFLVEAFEYMKNKKSLSSSDLTTLQTKTFYGKEIKSLAYIIGVMNMILHGIEAPNIKHTNTLAENIADIQEKDRVDVILANPPFGAGIRKEVQQNFQIKSRETAYLFLQHFIKMLRAGGRAGIIIKNTFLSNDDAANIRKELLNSCEVKIILDLPAKVFSAGVKTVVLFFEKGAPTKKIWYYQLNLDRNLGKTNPLSVTDLEDFLRLQKTKADSANSWFLDAKDLNQETFDLSVKNPNQQEAPDEKDPIDIINSIEGLDNESKNLLDEIKKIL